MRINGKQPTLRQIFLGSSKNNRKIRRKLDPTNLQKDYNPMAKTAFSSFYDLIRKTSDTVYWASVEEKRKEFESKLRDKHKTVEVLVDRSHTLHKNNENLEFRKIVNRDIILANAIHGVPHMMGEGYVSFIPILWLSEIARRNIRHRIRLGFDYLIGDYWLRSKPEEAYKLGKLLASFDKNHYDHFLVLARLCHQLELDDEARDNYDSAIEICKRDEEWNKRKKPTDPSIEEIIETIRKEKQKFSKR